MRLIDSCVTQLKAQGPSRTCNESKEEEEEACRVVAEVEVAKPQCFTSSAGGDMERGMERPDRHGERFDNLGSFGDERYVEIQGYLVHKKLPPARTLQ